MSKRKFFKTIVQIEVLSEDVPVEFDDLEDLEYEVNEGGCSGKTTVLSVTQIDGKMAAQELMEQASDPSFFQLDENGNDLEEEGEE